MTTVLDATNGAGGNYEYPVGTDRLAVIVPVYNEERTVAELLRRLEAQPCVSQVIIVDDGSTDRTWEELAPWRARASFNSTTRVSDGDSVSVIVLQHHKNQGKGRAIRTGLEHVTCSHVIIQDADLEYDPADITKLWQVMLSGDADAVYGSRYLENPDLRRGRYLLQSGVRLLNFLVRIGYGLRLTDEATCYKLFRSHDLVQMSLECERFEFCPEVTAKAAQLRFRIREVAISYTPRIGSEGKKLRCQDGVHAVLALLRWRVSPFAGVLKHKWSSRWSRHAFAISAGVGLVMFVAYRFDGVSVTVSPRLSEIPYRLEMVWPKIASGISEEERTAYKTLIWPHQGENIGKIAHLLHGMHVAVEQHGVTDLPTLAEMMSVFLDDAVAKRWYNGQSVLQRTRNGLRYAMPLKFQKLSQAHNDQTLAILAELGVPLRTKIVLPDGDATVAALVSDCQSRYSFNDEYEWSTLALALYQPEKCTWGNEFGEMFTFTEAVERLIKEPLATRSCNGAHILMAVAAIVQIDQSHSILSTPSRQRARTFLKACMNAVTVSQEARGAFSLDWIRYLNVDPDYQIFGGVHTFSPNELAVLNANDRILCTSHLLEWMALLPHDIRPATVVFQRAIDFLHREVASISQGAINAAYCRWSHCVGVLLRYRQEDFETTEGVAVNERK